MRAIHVLISSLPLFSSPQLFLATFFLLRPHTGSLRKYLLILNLILTQKRADIARLLIGRPILLLLLLLLLLLF